MPNIVAAADQLASADVPVLFLDTCILLDIIRAVKRRFARYVERAVELHAAATTAPVKLRVVVSRLVEFEWAVNEQGLLAEATRHLEEMNEQSRHFHDACAVFGIATGFDRANYSGLGVASRMHDLSRQLLDCALVIDTDDECSGRAMQRVIHNIPPSQQGGEAKDCNILEEYLAVCRRLHAAAFSRRLVFCTSNKNDYCERADQLHPNLAIDFAAVGLRFTTNLPWAFHDVLN